MDLEGLAGLVGLVAERGDLTDHQEHLDHRVQTAEGEAEERGRRDLSPLTAQEQRRRER